MEVLSGLERLPQSWPNPVITIGNFDGVHIGHQSLMKTLVARAAAAGSLSAVLTFEPHPLRVLAPDHAPRQIQTLRQKRASLAALGIDALVVLPFTLELAAMSARSFVEEILLRRLRAREIHVGSSFAFGHRREGSFNLLRQLGEEHGFQAEKIHQVQFRGSRVSSTTVRQALITGQVALARRVLGRPFSLEGDVVHGTATGAGIRFPTANLRTRNEIVPQNGVYVTTTILEGRRWKSVTNIGTRPTITGTASGEAAIETHILDLGRDLYGAEIEVEFLLRLRDERRFPSGIELAVQIGRDVALARRYFLWLARAAPGWLQERVQA